MADYIKQEDVYQYLDNEVEWKVNQDRLYALEVINDFPTADVVEVRHGRWMTTDAYPHHLYCSVCYKTYAKNAKWVNELDLPTNYCPNCGAKMDLEEQEKE